MSGAPLGDAFEQGIESLRKARRALDENRIDLLAKCQEKSARIVELESLVVVLEAGKGCLDCQRRVEAAEAELKAAEEQIIGLNAVLAQEPEIRRRLEALEFSNPILTNRLESASARVKELEARVLELDVGQVRGCQGCQDRVERAFAERTTALVERDNFYGRMTRAEEEREVLRGQLVKVQLELQKTKETLELVVKDRDSAQNAAMSLSGCILAVRNAVHGRGGAGPGGGYGGGAAGVAGGGGAGGYR